MRLNRFMRRAVELSLQNARSAAGGPFGCVIVRKGRIIATGKNRVTRDCDSTAHGEIVALRKAERSLHRTDLRDCALYTSSQPCPGCLQKIKGANIRKMRFSNTRRMAGKIGFADDEIARRKIDIARMQDPLAPLAFETWAKHPKKKMYYQRHRRRKR